jgi:hypothetical protein
MAEAATVDPNLPVSHEVDGRILTGVGVSADALAETMERHEPEPAEPSEPAAASDPPAPKLSRGQRRFDELTREREEARREAETARRERDELRAKLEAASRPQPAAEQTAPSAQAQQQVAANPTRPKPSVDAVGSTYPTYEDFLEDLADWKAEQRLAAVDFDARIRQSIEADRASRSFADTVSNAFDRGRKAYPDFDAVITRGPGARITLGPTDAIGAARGQRLAQLPNGEHVMYAIGKDAAVAERIRQMDDVDFGMWLASMAPSQAVASPASTPAAGSPVIPAPYQPVGTGSKTSAIPLSDLPHKAGFDFDKSGYRERRAADRGIRR